MRKILAVFVAALLLFPASAYAVGINYGGTITSIERIESSLAGITMST